MSDQNSNDTITFDLPKNQSSVIKVIGVGGGGSNAVNHMFGQGIRGVDFVVCNTDSQALNQSPVPNKIQLGVTLTEGLGAGANPEVGQQAAQESIEEIKNLLQTNTKMVFITAGMGGGTGTGAAPVIAKAAKDAGILTVGICTIPFLFEGNNRKLQAEKGVEALRKNVDSLVVINNNKLREVYGNLGFKAGFAKADEVLATAARGIAEVITHHYTTNIDLRDAKTVLSDSGTAIMGSATAAGENRAAGAINKALDSPLLNDNHIRGAKNVLLLIVSGQEEITIDEIGEINDHIQMEAGGSANIIMGIGEDESLGEEIAVTIVATGFAADQQVQVTGREPQKVVHALEDEQAISAPVYTKPLAKEEDDVDDYFINKELARHSSKERKSAPMQPNLFQLDEDEADRPIPVKEDKKADETKMAKEPEEDIAIDLQEEKSAVFQIATEDENATTEDENEPGDVEMQKEDVAKETKNTHIPAPEEKEKLSTPEPKKETIRYTLQDYMNLEQQLKDAKPAESAKTANTRNEVEDQSLNFEVRQLSKPKQEAENTSKNVSPTDYTIEESMRLKAEERRLKMKAFNYRFKNHPYVVDDAAQEPAYKRQGVKIDEGNYSSESNMGRFTIDDSENGPDIKTNNSFLHDNVD